tara:strand:+ start:489 stop:947 length:459 start_codon:yes stop_codon:yes gene_type:complete
MGRFTYRGKYKPIYTEKYIGNISNVTYRSGWERRFMKYCDLNKNVLMWSSEELIIPYLSPVDKKQHKYYPDFLIKVKDLNGNKKTVVIEVKPKRETQPPKKKKTVTPRYLQEIKTWSVNEAKWKYANEFCKDRNWEFKILTEDFKALITDGS